MESFNFSNIKPVTRRRSSFFGYDSETTSHTDSKSIQETYFEKLAKEQKDWAKILYEINTKYKTKWRDIKEKDFSNSLNLEQQEYLKKSINMEDYLKDLSNFCNTVSSYVSEKNWFYQRNGYAIDLIEDRLLEQQKQLLTDIEKI